MQSISRCETLVNYGGDFAPYIIQFVLAAGVIGIGYYKKLKK